MDNSEENVSSEAESYLKSVSDFISRSYDPKLKQEEKKLVELLESHKKLCERLKKKYSEETKNNFSEVNLEKIPEIYAILHPELYANVRDVEKEKLIAKFAKKKSLIHPLGELRPLSSTANLYDLRQKEKERFTKLIAGTPSAFHNLAPPKRTQRRSIHTSDSTLTTPVENFREKEKDRLARIFSSSITKTKSTTKYNARKLKESVSNPETQVKKTEVTKKISPGNKISSRPITAWEQPQSKKSNEIVQGKNQPPANSGMKNSAPKRDIKSVGKPLLNLNYTARKKRMEEYRQQRHSLKNRVVSQGMQSVKRPMEEVPAEKVRSRCTQFTSFEDGSSKSRSIATQTEEPFVPRTSPTKSEAYPEGEEQKEKETSDSLLKAAEMVVVSPSPREKLMSDLHGDMVFFNHPNQEQCNSNADERYAELKYKQNAYADALKAQILEKKRIEEERRRKEKEEEDLIERRAREQQQKLQMEYNKEKSQRIGLLQQRAAQEELLRQRIQEMELEAQQLKKMEKRKKWATQPPPLDEHNGRFSMKPGLDWGVEQKSPRVDEARRVESMMKAPLLEADRQNILSERLRASPRPPSPVLPAVRTENILRNSPRYADPIFQDGDDSPGGGMRRADSILTQLGAFRRQLQLEQLRLEARLQAQSPT